MSRIDFLVPAELFVKLKSSLRIRNSVKYRRFDTLYSAVQFAMDEYEADLNAIFIQTDWSEYTGHAIRSLYENEEYPLVRGSTATKLIAGTAPASSRRRRASVHKYKLGDIVVFAHPGPGRGRSAPYEVVKILPTENAELAYRIKAKNEPHERVVKEHEISLA